MPKPKQQQLPGTESKHDKFIEQLADDYEEKRDARVSCSAPEKEAKTKLMDAMRAAGLSEYRYDGKLVQIVPGKETVKVKAIEDEDADDEDGEEEGEE